MNFDFLIIIIYIIESKYNLYQNFKIFLIITKHFLKQSINGECFVIENRKVLLLIYKITYLKLDKFNFYFIIYYKNLWGLQWVNFLIHYQIAF